MATKPENPSPIFNLPIFIPENWSDITLTITTSSSLVPFSIVGEIIAYTGLSVPSSNFLFCDGSGYSTTLYSDLFALIGYTYGGSGGSFLVPDLRNRTPVGSDSISTLTTTYEGTPVSSGGNKTMSVNQLAQHNHSVTGLENYTGMLQNLNQNSAIQGIGAGTFDLVKTALAGGATYTATAGNAGNSADLLPPFSVCNFIIRAH